MVWAADSETGRGFLRLRLIQRIPRRPFFCFFLLRSGGFRLREEAETIGPVESDCEDTDEDRRGIGDGVEKAHGWCGSSPTPAWKAPKSTPYSDRWRLLPPPECSDRIPGVDDLPPAPMPSPAVLEDTEDEAEDDGLNSCCDTDPLTPSEDFESSSPPPPSFPIGAGGGGGAVCSGARPSASVVRKLSWNTAA